jgi:YD repeat-containing protein
LNGQPTSGTYESGSNRIDTFGNVLYELDLNGNTIEAINSTGPSHEYVYSPHNRLTELVDSTTSNTLATYQYDALGQRVAKSTSAETRKFMYGPNGELLVILDGSGAILNEYVYLAGQPVANGCKLKITLKNAAR